MNDGAPVRPPRDVELGASNEEYQNLHEFVRKARAGKIVAASVYPALDRQIALMEKLRPTSRPGDGAQRLLHGSRHGLQLVEFAGDLVRVLGATGLGQREPGAPRPDPLRRRMTRGN